MSLLLTSVLATVLGASQGEPVAYRSFVYAHHGYHSVQVDIASGKVAAGVVSEPKLTSVWRLVGKVQPIAAITGTFFDVRSQLPVADVLVDGNLRGHGSRGTVVAVDWFGGVRIFDRPFKSHVDWSEFRYGLRGAVRIVADGKVRPNPKAQRFRDRRIWGRAARTGLGLTRGGKLILFVTRNKVTLSEFGKAMRSRGVVDGVSLDGGGSTCLYYKGGLVVSPHRRLNNLFVVCTKRRDSLPVTSNAPDFPTGGAAATPTADVFNRFPIPGRPLHIVY